MIAGCVFLDYACNTAVTFEDASGDSRFSPLIGSDYQSTEELKIYGITMERHYAPILDHYTVTTLPGFGGREVLSEHLLAIGTTVRIVKVLRCINCHLDFGERIQAVVEIASRQEFSKAPIKVKIELFEGPERAFTRVER